MVCPRCHETNTNLSRFCKKCGAVLLTQAELKKKEQNAALNRELQIKRAKEEAAKQQTIQEPAKTQEETPIQNAIRKAAEAKAAEELKFEYDIVTVPNNKNGSTDVAAIKKILTAKAALGWRLVSSYSNELGRIRNSGTNSTICEDVLYFERIAK